VAAPAPALAYEQLRQRVHAEVGRSVPPGATVLVVSRGDGALLDLGAGRRGWHFPQTVHGTYAGHHPVDSRAAIDQVEALRQQGAGFLLFPETALWWLDHYTEFREHLDRHYRIVAESAAVCRIYALDRRGEEGT
jgi:hypothetical protein